MTGNRRASFAWAMALLAWAGAAVTTLALSGGLAGAFSAPELTPTVTNTPGATPLPGIDIGNATPIACGQARTGDTTGGSNNVSVYGCVPWWPMTGPERVFSLTLDTSSDVDALLSGLSSDLDLFLLTGASPASCIAYGDNAISVRGLGAGVYYLVVDGFDGAAGPFQLNVWCPLAVTPTPTPTITPTATPLPIVSSHYLPLLLHSPSGPR
jgi:hypothetical protein